MSWQVLKRWAIAIVAVWLGCLLGVVAVSAGVLWFGLQLGKIVGVLLMVSLFMVVLWLMEKYEEHKR